MTANVDDAFGRWSATNLRPQKQSGYAIVVVTIPLGDFTGQQMRVLADLTQAYADGTARVTVSQDLVLRWVPSKDVPALYRRLAAAGLGVAGADTIADVTSCPGAESCKLAVTQSRGLGRTLEQFLRRAGTGRARARPRHQGERLPERLRATPCGRHRIQGQLAEGRGGACRIS